MGARKSYKSERGFLPSDSSALVGWHKIANATVTGSGVSSLPNEFGSPAVQTIDSARPPLSTSGNGFPIMQFDGARYLVDPLQTAINNNANFFGMGLWLRSPLNTVVRSIYSVRNTAGSANAERMAWQIASSELVFVDFFLDNSNRRRLSTNAAQALGGWEFWTIAHQGSLSGDARVLQHKNGVIPASTYSAVGVAAEEPATLVTPTGNAFIGVRTTALLEPFIGDIGPNIYFYNRQLTTQEFIDFAAYEQPIG